RCGFWILDFGFLTMLSRFFIDRPIFATVLSVAITLTGGIALISLPIAQYPRITPPGVSVSISYPGANAQVVAETVAAPVEQQVTGIPGMLGTAVFSGMLGVTLFGIFLTPVFFYVIQGFGETKLFAAPERRTAVSCTLGVLIGITGGYLVGRLVAVPVLWAALIGACAGLLAVLALKGIHRQIRG